MNNESRNAMGTIEIPIENVEIVFIPKEVQDELDRLHKLLLSEAHHSYKEMAKELLVQIHKCYFTGTLIFTGKTE